MRAVILCAALVLAACDVQTEPPADQTATPSPEPGAELEELGEVDLAALNLSGELACSFRREIAASPIWLGRGDVGDAAGAEAAVKLGGAARKLTMADEGGYDAMADGARFEGEGVALTIATTSDEPYAEEPQVAMESPVYPATLTYAVNGEEEQIVEGLFECGP